MRRTSFSRARAVRQPRNLAARRRGWRPKWLNRSALATATVLLGTLSCGDSGTDPPDPPDPPAPVATTVAVGPATVELTALGATAQLSAEVRDQNGQVMAGASVMWASSDTLVATVDAGGLVTAAGNGGATISAAAGLVSGTAAVAVAQEVSAVAVTPSADTLVALGDTARFVAEATDANGHAVAGAEFSWSSSDTLVATVDAGGLVTAAGNGSATITATAGDAQGSAEIAVETPVENRDRAALVALYEATDGPNWVNNENWLSQQPLGEWYGVGTDHGGRVRSLHLSGGWDPGSRRFVRHGLVGTIPGELGELANLEYLELSFNELSGAIPPELGNLVNLEDLYLLGNQLSGPIPPELGNLVNLKVLYLLMNQLSGPIPPELGALANLGHLDFATNRLSGPIPPELGDLANLRYLQLHGNGLSGAIPPELGNLVNLEYMGMSQTDLSGPIPPELGNLTKLERLELNKIDVSGPIPPELGNLANLERLAFSWSGLSGPIPPELGNLANLEYLELGGNALSGPIPPELGNLVDLKGLALSWNGLSGPIPPELGDLANLRDLWLEGNALSGPIPPELGNLAKLQLLFLKENELSGAIPPGLGKLANLEALTLNNNALSGPIPPELGNLVRLYNLPLQNNALSGPIPPELGNLPNLHTLFLAENDLSGPVPSTFGRLARLTALNLSHNAGLAGALPGGMKEVGGLQSLLATGTGLCVPRGRAFEAWLATIPRRRIGLCGEPPAAYLVQAVQSRTHPVPLVAGEDALLRVLVTTATETTEGIPEVRARFYLNGTERYLAEIGASSTPIPTEINEGELSKSANAEVPGGIVRPGLEMVVEIDPGGALDPSLGVPTRIPEEGRLAVDVREMPRLDLTVIPFLWSSDPDSGVVGLVEGMAADPEGHPLLEATHVLLPVGELDFTAHAPVVSTSNNGFDLLSQTEAIRVLEGRGGHHMGMMSGYTTGPGGVAHLFGWSSFAWPNTVVIAHELGHNMSLFHAPCGGAGGPDPSFPHPWGKIGAWGYDLRRARLVSPLRWDHMSYCDPRWTSDYHFTNALEYRLRNAASSAAALATAPVRSLLLWGGVDTTGTPFLNPAFVADAPPALPDSAGDYTVTGRDADGRELFSLAFAMPVAVSEEAEVSSFAFALPVQPGWADALASVTLSGPAGTAVLDGDSDIPMAILRDPRTGQVRGILRDSPGLAADAAGPDTPGLEVLFSRGIPDGAGFTSPRR